MKEHFLFCDHDKGESELTSPGFQTGSNDLIGQLSSVMFPPITNRLKPHWLIVLTN